MALLLKIKHLNSSDTVPEHMKYYKEEFFFFNMSLSASHWLLQNNERYNMLQFCTKVRTQFVTMTCPSLPNSWLDCCEDKLFVKCWHTLLGITIRKSVTKSITLPSQVALEKSAIIWLEAIPWAIRIKQKYWVAVH